jgi:hypothetical protein
MVFWSPMGYSMQGRSGGQEEAVLLSFCFKAGGE